jgi:hypothetical protein
MEIDATETSPMKVVSEELDTLRLVFREALDHYSTRLEGQIDEVKAAVAKVAEKEKVPASKLRDIRDMLTLLRHMDSKVAKGRRKDLKKIDSIVGDLAMLIENW